MFGIHRCLTRRVDESWIAALSAHRSFSSCAMPTHVGYDILWRTHPSYWLSVAKPLTRGPVVLTFGQTKGGCTTCGARFRRCAYIVYVLKGCNVFLLPNFVSWRAPLWDLPRFKRVGVKRLKLGGRHASANIRRRDGRHKHSPQNSKYLDESSIYISECCRAFWRVFLLLTRQHRDLLS